MYICMLYSRNAQLYVYICVLFKKCTVHQLHGPSTAPSAGILSGERFWLKIHRTLLDTLD